MMKRQPENTGELLLRSPQALIHIEHSITLQQYKYWLLLYDELQRQIAAGIEPDAAGMRYMPMEKLAGYIGYVPKKFELWNDLRSLKNQTLVCNLFSKDGEGIKY